MLKSVDWADNRLYHSGGDWEPFQFYLDVLNESNSFDLLLGYFSSAAINVLSLGFAKFLSSGGKVRMIINDVLSHDDKEVVKRVSDGYVYQIPFNLSNFDELKSRLDDYDLHFFQCLGWLIQNKRIDIKIIRPLGKKGISHYKCGIFSDGVDKVGFSGSCNFTAFGLLENLERIDTFNSWEDTRSNIWVRSQEEEFSDIFSGKAKFVEYLDADEIKTAILTHFGNTDIDQLLINEQELIQLKSELFKSKRLKKAIESSKKRIQISLDAPRFPFAEGPRDYQIEAYNNWVAKSFHGIFAMATGTGKTITSLNCLLQESAKTEEGIYHAIILVPTITLVNQWEDEAKSFNFQDVIKISSKNKWESTLATSLSTNKRIPTSFVVIATYASFIKQKFLKYLPSFPSDTIFIADEAHNIGSPSVLNKLVDFPLVKRIGLSATPKRIYDPEGSEVMEAFFNDQAPYTYSFSMERAISEGILCKYNYYPHIVSLTAEEFDEYIIITKQLSKFFNGKTNDFDKNDIVEKLLLKRKRIIHKAENKLTKTKSILGRRFKEEGNLNYTFLYVPEGFVSESIEQDEESDDGFEEETKIINLYTKAVAEIDPNIMVNQFTSSMHDRNSILDQFKVAKIQVLASMKCLDEGVDIPRAEHAIFCSSTGNPRQFIQRRGRILRKHIDKSIATIHDLIVVPDLEASDRSSDTFQTEKSLVEKELERVMYFASLSINPFHTEDVFKSICEHYDLNIYTIHQNLKNQ